MSDQPEDPNGTEEAVTEPAPAWPEAEPGPAWETIADEGGSPAPGPAGPGAEPAAAVPEAEPEPEPATEVQPAIEAARSRRPTSLRDQYVQDTETVARRKLSAPAFPSAPSVPGSEVTPPVSEEPEQGNPAPVSVTTEAPPATEAHAEPRVSRTPNIPSPASLLGKLPKDRIHTDKIPMDKLPLDKLPTDKLPLEKLRTLSRQRPEVGVGIAFAGGLVIATILKRLGRR